MITVHPFLHLKDGAQGACFPAHASRSQLRATGRAAEPLRIGVGGYRGSIGTRREDLGWILYLPLISCRDDTKLVMVLGAGREIFALSGGFYMQKGNATVPSKGQRAQGFVRWPNRGRKEIRLRITIVATPTHTSVFSVKQEERFVFTGMKGFGFICKSLII